MSFSPSCFLCYLLGPFPRASWLVFSFWAGLFCSRRRKKKEEAIRQMLAVTVKEPRGESLARTPGWGAQLPQRPGYPLCSSLALVSPLARWSGWTTSLFSYVRHITYQVQALPWNILIQKDIPLTVGHALETLDFLSQRCENKSSANSNKVPISPVKLETVAEIITQITGTTEVENCTASLEFGNIFLEP